MIVSQVSDIARLRGSFELMSGLGDEPFHVLYPALTWRGTDTVHHLVSDR